MPPERRPVLPPGPFPPHGTEDDGVIDLGIRLRDALYTRQMISGPIRQALAQAVGHAANNPSRMLRAPRLPHLLADTWPLAELVDSARQQWVAGPDGRALAILARAADVVSTALGWPATLDRLWPMPDESNIRSLVPEPGPYEILRRGPRDGAPGLAALFDAPMGPRVSLDLPPVLEVHGDELATQRDRLIHRLRSGEGVAVRFLSPVPHDSASLDALEACRDAGSSQRSFERYGMAGLQTPHVPTFEDLLHPAPPQPVGPRIRRTCEVLMLPSLTQQGAIEPVACLVWDGAHTPVWVVAGAGVVLMHLQEPKHLRELASVMELSEDQLGVVVAQLANVGAIAPCPEP